MFSRKATLFVNGSRLQFAIFTAGIIAVSNELCAVSLADRKEDDGKIGIDVYVRRLGRR